MFYLVYTLGYKSGCVDQYRYDRAMKLESELMENIELLKSFQKPVTKWRGLLNMEINNNPTIKRYVCKQNGGLFLKNMFLTKWKSHFTVIDVSLILMILIYLLFYFIYLQTFFYLSVTYYHPKGISK